MRRHLYFFWIYFLVNSHSISLTAQESVNLVQTSRRPSSNNRAASLKTTSGAGVRRNYIVLNTQSNRTKPHFSRPIARKKSQPSIANYSYTESIGSKPKVKEEVKGGFTNTLNFSYDNSAYRYAGEEFPSKGIGFGLTPAYDTPCFSASCNFSLKILGSFDLNNNGKNELGLIQMSAKMSTDPWSGYLTPDYVITGFLPATAKEINDEHMVFGYGGAFALSTTKDLLGTEVIAFKASVSARKNIHEEPLTTQPDWTSRQALKTSLQFNKEWSSVIIFGHIYSIGYDGVEKEITEMSQEIDWQATEWLGLSIGHSNIGPMYKSDGYTLNTDLVNIDQSTISLGVSITNKF